MPERWKESMSQWIGDQWPLPCNNADCVQQKLELTEIGSASDVLEYHYISNSWQPSDLLGKRKPTPHRFIQWADTVHRHSAVLLEIIHSNELLLFHSVSHHNPLMFYLLWQTKTNVYIILLWKENENCFIGGWNELAFSSWMSILCRTIFSSGYSAKSKPEYRSRGFYLFATPKMVSF